MAKTLKKNFRTVFLSGLGLLFAAAVSFAQPPERVRVLIIRNAESFSLRVKGDYSILDPSGGLIHSGSDLYATVTAGSNRIMMGEQNFKRNNLFIAPKGEDAIDINDRSFRGGILLINDRPGKVSVVNYLSLEDYIQGVLYHEVSHYWPDEVLKAQAIVTRTYALYQMEQNESKDFDVTSDIYSQVYGGRTSERYRLNRAVSSTAGLVLTYQGKLLPAFFHASCGGHTEDASVVWKNVDLPPLKGVECPFCKESPHYSWHYVLSLDEIAQKLKSAGIKCGAIKEIGIVGRDRSGRVTDVRITPSKSGSADIIIPAKDLRNYLGPNVIMSTNFTVSIVGDDTVFTGFGWGHGVGLCQWGGYFMARRGDNYEQILNYYYPGAQIIQRNTAGA